jgi:hypothetical protein
LQTDSELPIRLESSPSPSLHERASQYEAYESSYCVTAAQRWPN